MTDPVSRLLLAVTLAWLPASQGPELTFSGIGLRSELDRVAVQFPHSERSGDYIYVAPEDSRDHISGIGISSAGGSRFVRISFERRLEPSGLEYPTCAAIQSKIARQLGGPDSTLDFAEEATERSDRLWRRGGEALRLMCFRNGPGRRLWAEAVVIEPRPGGA
jgi:hypothetical protein